MKPRHIALLLASMAGGCAHQQAETPQAEKTAELCYTDEQGNWIGTCPPDPGQPWSCEDYDAEGQRRPRGCVSEARHEAWDGKRYRPFCEGRRKHPGRNDPWVLYFIAKGNSVEDARIVVSDNRINGCD